MTQKEERKEGDRGMKGMKERKEGARDEDMTEIIEYQLAFPTNLILIAVLRV
jgi:hypothetical protein